MQIFHTTSAFLIMFVLCSRLNYPVAVIVRYPREPVKKTEGLTLSLKCTVEYRTEDCDIEAKWFYSDSSESQPIVDNNRYLITVNETELATDKQRLRLRNIFLTISSLKLRDTGLYQCNAECLNSGTEAKGHLLNVTAYPFKDPKVSTWSGQLKADVAVLAFSTILFLMCY